MLIEDLAQSSLVALSQALQYLVFSPGLHLPRSWADKFRHFSHQDNVSVECLPILDKKS